MLFTGGLLSLCSLQGALDYLPILKKYYEKPVVDRIPILFALFARYRDAELCFDEDGTVTGYTEPSLIKDQHLKELFILSVGSLQNNEIKSDLQSLWNSLKGICFGSRHTDFPELFSLYILTGGDADKYPQSVDVVTKEVSRCLKETGAKRIFEVTGKIGLVGDEYEEWERYSEYLPDWRERYLDELLRKFNENRTVSYVKDNYLENDSLKIKEYDTIIVNLASKGGLSSEDEQFACIPSCIDRLLHLHSDFPGCDCRQAVLIFDYDFSKSGKFAATRDKLTFYGSVKSISFIYGLYIVMLVDLSGYNDAINYRVLHDISNSMQTESYSLPLNVIYNSGNVYDPEIISGKGTEPGEERTYLIALAGNPLSKNDISYLEKNHFKIMYDVQSLEGENGLKHLLDEDSERPLKTINAVIMDAVTDFDETTPFKYEGLAQAERLVADNVPFFIYTNVQKKDLGPIAGYAAKTLIGDGVYFGPKDRETLSSLAAHMRDKLDNVSKPDATIRAKYARELEAADWIDRSGEMTRQIIKIMKEDIRDDSPLEHTEDLLNGLRKCADAIFVSAKEVFGILPPLDKLGEMHCFLSDREFYDNKKRCLYVLDDPGFIPEALVCSLGYFISMTNGASHAAGGNNIDVCGYIVKSNRSGVYKACAFILLDLLCWYKDAVHKSTKKRFSVNELFNDNDRVQKIVCPGYGEFYFIGKLHLQPRHGLREGIPGKDIQVGRVGKEQKKPDSPDLSAVKYYVDKRNYEICQVPDSSTFQPD